MKICIHGTPHLGRDLGEAGITSASPSTRTLPPTVQTVFKVAPPFSDSAAFVLNAEAGDAEPLDLDRDVLAGLTQRCERRSPESSARWQLGKQRTDDSVQQFERRLVGFAIEELFERTLEHVRGFCHAAEESHARTKLQVVGRPEYLVS